MSIPSEPPATIAGLVAPRRRSGGNLALILALVVAAGGIAFAAGRATAPAAAAAQPGSAGQLGQVPGSSFDPNANGVPGGVPGSRSMSLEGTVTALDGTTLTIATSDGQTVSVDVAGATYHAQTAATETDVAAGATVRLEVTGMGGPGGPGGAPASPAASAGASSVTASDVMMLAP
jgi:hypothetical protein